MFKVFKTKKILLLILLFIASSLVITISTLIIVHTKSANTLKKDLSDLANSEKSLIMLLYQQGNSEDAITNIFSKTNNNHLILGRTGEFTIAKQAGDSIDFKCFINQSDAKINLRFKDNFSKTIPLHLALSGKSGSVKSKDYKGRMVYAGYAWIQKLQWAIIVKIEASEFDTPYIEASLIALLIAVILITIVSLLYVRIANPIINDLIENENKLRVLFDNSADAIFIMDMETNFLDVNETALSRLKYTKEELLKLSAKDVNEKDALPKVMSLMSQIKKDGAIIAEVNHVTGDGNVIPTEINARIINYNGSKAILSVARDITIRRQALNRLSESEKLYRFLFDNMLNGYAYCQMIYSEGIPCDFVYLSVNKSFEDLTGLRNVTGKRVSEVIPGILELDPGLIATYGRVALTGTPESFETFVEALEMWFSISVYSPQKDYFVAIFDVVTERKQIENERETTIKLLSLLNQNNNVHDLMKTVTQFLHSWTGCEAVGIRLKDGNDYPYYETFGFPEDFVEKEKYLCAYDINGQMICDEIGHPVLECMCGNILCSRFDPSKPFFTKSGSFWSNCTTELLASTTEADRQSRTRNRCNGMGYESVALIPLRVGNETFGLIQLNDKRVGRFKPGMMTLLERMGDNIALALHQRKTQKALMENEFILKQKNEEYEVINEELRETNEILENAKKAAEEINFFLTESQKVGLVGSYKTDFVAGFWKSSETLDSIFGIDLDYVRSVEGWLNIVYLGDREMLNDYLVNEVIGKRKIFDKEYRITRINDKQTRWVHGYGETRFDENGNIISMIGTIQDITEHKLIQENLAKNINLLRDMMDNSTSLIYLIDSSGKFISVNKPFEKIFGFSVEEFVGKTREEIMPKEYAKQHFVNDQEVISTGQPITFDEENIEADGKHYYHTIKFPLKDMHNNIYGISGISLDITERVMAERELFAAKERAEESDRLKTAFLQNMSHEIRTPLNAIMGFSQLLEKNFNNKPKLENFTNVIIKRGKDLLEIINGILDIAKIESGALPVHYENIDLLSVFEELSLFFSEHAKQLNKSQIEFRMNPELCTHGQNVTIDGGKLKQIFINLIGNAFKFTQSGKIEAGCRVDQNNRLIFYVSDTGIGIPGDKHAVIFERFMQATRETSRLYGGTGLGLSIVKGLLNLLGGEIWLESEVGKGSTFYFVMPYQVEELKENNSQPRKEEYDFSVLSGNVLIVEDDLYNANLLQEMLASTNLHLIIANLGKEAISIVHENAVDIVLLDIRLPDINGYEVAKEIKKIKPSARIIAQTAYAAISDKKQALESGCDDYINKPINSEVLMSKIRNCLIEKVGG